MANNGELCWFRFVREVENRGGKVLASYEDYEGPTYAYLCQCEHGHQFYLRPSKFKPESYFCLKCLEIERAESETRLVNVIAAIGDTDMALANWTDKAACKGMDLELFFGWARNGTREEIIDPEVWNVCSTCPVRIDCLRFAIFSPENYGIWGGMAPFQRRRMRKRILHRMLVTHRRRIS